MKTNREELEQRAVIQWSELYQELRWLHHIPNGGHRHKVTAAKLKAMGVKSGVLDLFLPVVRLPYHGLYIEMKNPETKSKLSKTQIEFSEHCEYQGYKVVTCWTAGEAIGAIKTYMGWNNNGQETRIF